MPPKVYNGFSIELEPHYHLIQQLPANASTFAASLLASEKVLSFPDNEDEQRFKFTDVSCYNNAIPLDFERAIPGTEFSGYDVNVPYFAQAGLQNIHLDLHDKANLKRHVKIQPALGEDDTLDLEIFDNYPDRRPKSAKTIGREAIRNFLAWQLQAAGVEGAVFELSSEQQLAMLVGQYARGQRHTIRTAHTTLEENRVLHAEKEEVYDRESETGEPVSTTHSLWLTTLLPNEAVDLATNVRARTVARTNTDIQHPGNSLAFEVEAVVASEEDATELTKQLMLLQVRRKLQTAQAFSATISHYLQAAR